MPNLNVPFGLRLVAEDGKESNVSRFPKKSGNIIAAGDPVIFDASGTVDIAGATGGIVGIAMEYKAATDTSDIAVCTDPDAVYEVQASANLVQTDVFSNAQLSSGTADPLLKRSTWKLDSSTIATTATHQLKILGASKLPGNAYGSYARVLVKINNHILKGGTGTAGV